MAEPWSDSMKWRMDLLKNAASFAVAAIVSLFIIDHVQEQRAAAKAKEDAYYAAKLRALDELRQATVHYDAAANAAFADLFEWTTRTKTNAMRRYEEEAYPRWVAALETAAFLYPDLAEQMGHLSVASRRRHEIYDSLVDTRLDRKGEITQIDPWAKRADYRELNKELVARRQSLLMRLQLSVFPNDAD